MSALNKGLCLDGPLQGEEHEWEGDKHVFTDEVSASFHTPGQVIPARVPQPFTYEYQQHIAGGGRIEGFWVKEGTLRAEATVLIQRMFGRLMEAGGN